MPRRVGHISRIPFIDTSDGTFSQGPERVVKSKQGPTLRSDLYEEDLVAFASQPATEAERRVDRILTLISRLIALRHEDTHEKASLFVWEGRVLSGPPVLKKPTREVRHLAIELNACFFRYKFIPHFWRMHGDHFLIGWWSGINRPLDEEGDDVPFTEEDAVIRIIHLGREGLLDRLGKCACGDWFFKKFSHQRFCCLGCQQHDYRSNPEWRAKHREYMKNLRALKKQRYFPTPQRKKTSAKKSGKG